MPCSGYPRGSRCGARGSTSKSCSSAPRTRRRSWRCSGRSRTSGRIPHTERTGAVAVPQEQEQKKTQKRSGGAGAGEGAGQVASTSKGEKLKEEMDDILDEIDSVLEENAEEFVKSYVQKGGE